MKINPVLYYNYNTNIVNNENHTSRIRRLNKDYIFSDILFITVSDKYQKNNFVCSRSPSNIYKKIVEECKLALKQGSDFGLEYIQKTISNKFLGNYSEIQIRSGISINDFLLINKYLQEIRLAGVLIICYDETRNPNEHIEGPWNRDICFRNEMRKWIDNCRLKSAFNSFVVIDNNLNVKKNVEIIDSIFPVLYVSFYLGGEIMPQRIFSLSNDDGENVLLGYSWMK